MLVDLEGYGEDKIVYNEGKQINNKCYELKSNPNQFKSRYIIWNKGLDRSDSNPVGAQSVLLIGLLGLFVLLVVTAFVIGTQKPIEENNEQFY